MANFADATSGDHPLDCHRLLAAGSFASNPRAAATGNNVGDTVYVNLDVIVELDRKHRLALLVHEYGHHHGVRDEDHRSLDTLAAKIVEEIKFETHALSGVYMPHGGRRAHRTGARSRRVF